jgi:hypothetical protein
MKQQINDDIGAAWLIARYALQTVMPLRSRSRIGGRRSTQLSGEERTETYVQSMRPAATLRGHLTFHLKHEPPHLELLARLFAQCDVQELIEWIIAEPNGQYARRTGFFYEFLLDRELPVQAVVGGSYVDALDVQKIVVASSEQAIANPRWRVRNNLPGTRAFCPMVHKTPATLLAMALDVPALIQSLHEAFGDELLLRSAVWMTLRESKSSFVIEGEADQADRISRFADVLARSTGQGEGFLEQEALARLQSEILGQRCTLQQFGMRQSPVFVGQVIRFQEMVHYIAPPAEDLPAMLEGLRVFMARTAGQSPVLRAAVLAFGFVYIHPLADGNGRVHRFLINDSLRRDGVVSAPMILPVSSLITRESAERQAYDQVLDDFSRPLMQSLAGCYEFARTALHYPDGISSNFVFKGHEQVSQAWSMPDLTKHVIWLSAALERTINLDMREESTYLRNHAQARRAIKEIIEMPDMQIDRVIRSIEANQGKLSNLLAKEIPALLENGIWDEIVQAVEKLFSLSPLE